MDKINGALAETKTADVIMVVNNVNAEPNDSIGSNFNCGFSRKVETAMRVYISVI